MLNGFWSWMRVLPLLGAALQTAACDAGTTTGDGGSDRVFQSCNSGEDCPVAMSCICEVCFYACDEGNGCSTGTCESLETLEDPNCLVDPLAAISVCLDECGTSADCAAGECVNQRCVPERNISGPGDDDEISDVATSADVADTSVDATEADPNSDDLQAGGDAVSENCRIEVSVPFNQLTEDFEAQPDCTCTRDNPSCHSLFRAQVVALNGNSVTLSGQKASLNSGQPEPSAPVFVRILAGESESPLCTDLDLLNERSRIEWSSGTTFTIEGNVWPTQREFEEAQPGAEVYLFVASGSGTDAPEQRIFFQPTAIGFRKVCD